MKLQDVKMQDVKLQDVKMQDQLAGCENRKVKMTDQQYVKMQDVKRRT